MVDFGALLRKKLIAKYGLTRNGHSHFSASGSPGWLNCDAYVLVNAVLPDKDSEYSAYGTVAHEVAAVWLNAIRDEGREVAEHVPKRFKGFKTVEGGYEIVCDELMLHHIRTYIDRCAEVEHLGHVLIEQKVSYSKYLPIPNQGGTCDHAVLAPGLLIIDDLKMGEGVPVFADENTQALCYALGVYLEWNWLFDFKRIIIRINQPRLDYFGEWECDVPYLLKFAGKVRAAGYRSWKENAPRTPGPKQCRWCADKKCVAKDAMITDAVRGAFDDGDVSYTQEELQGHAVMMDAHKATPVSVGKQPVNLTTAALEWRKKHRPIVDAYFREVEAELLKRATDGETLALYKKTQGRNSYAWADEDTAKQALVKQGLTLGELTVEEMISVKQARDLLRAHGLRPKGIKELLMDGEEPIVRTTPGKPTLALKSDDRVDLGDQIGAAFGDGDDGEL